MGQHHDHKFSNEGSDYRAARDDLLTEELKLRRQAEKVTALRRALPLGGEIAEDYIFQNLSGKDIKFSELFSDKSPELFIYNFMYPPGGVPCPICTSYMDSLNGGVTHIEQHFNCAVIAKASAEELRAWAGERNWSNLTFLSSGKTTFNIDYNAEDDQGRQLMALNTFRKTNDGIFHTWSFELFYARGDRKPDARHSDVIWPFSTIYDVTLDGRPSDWSLAYNYN